MSLAAKRTPAALLLLGTLVCASAALADGKRGAEVFNEWCAGCHSDSPLSPGTVLLRATRGAEFAVIEKRTDLTPEFIEHLVRKGRGGMPSFRRTEIGVDDMAALVDYLTSNQRSTR